MEDHIMKKTGQYLEHHCHSYKDNDKGQSIDEVVSSIPD